MFRVIPHNTSSPMFSTVIILAALAAFVAVDATNQDG